MKVPDAAIGAAVAALIAGLVSLLGLIISKEQKISDFRQAWIDALRSDLTTYLSHINAIANALNTKFDNFDQKLAMLQPLYTQLNESSFNIQLRVNPNENTSRELLKVLKEFTNLAAEEVDLTPVNLRRLESAFLQVSQSLLKSEWSRVKLGEPTFRIAKFVASAVILALIGVGAWATLRSLGFEWHSTASVYTPSEATPGSETSPSAVSLNIRRASP